MTSRLFTLFCSVFLFSSPSVFALNLCGGKVEQNTSLARFLMTGTKTHCSITKTKECSLELSSTAPKECKSGDVFELNRSAKDKRWHISLRTLTKLPDLGRLAISIDHKDPLEMPGEFLSHGTTQDLKEVHIDPRLTKVIIEALKNAQKATLLVTYGKDQQYTTTLDTKNFEGLTRAFKWVDCMQSLK